MTVPLAVFRTALPIRFKSGIIGSRFVFGGEPQDFDNLCLSVYKYRAERLKAALTSVGLTIIEESSW